MEAVRVEHAPVVDGRLDDEAWTHAKPTSAFTQKFPNEGASPSERTTVRVVYDEEAIYVGIDCEQRTAPFVARLTRRDREIESDRIEIAIDSRGDGRTGIELGVNAAGVLSDSLLFNDTDETDEWDENWEGKAARTDRGWSVEIKVPLRILRFGAKPELEFGFQVRRWISARQEVDEWSLVSRKAGGEVSHFGRLGGLGALTPKYPVELKPFVLGRVRRRDPVDEQLAAGTDVDGSAGLDLKWHPTSSLALDAAVNPDFAQVEADKIILNLTTYETFYPEKRPFFLEGRGTFSTPLQIFYSRRIGRAVPSPELRTGAPFSERLVEAPEPARILGATKLVGRIGDAWEVGTLSALVAPSKVSVQLPDGSRVRRTVDPFASYQVLRLKRELAENAHVGVMWTQVTRADNAADHPLLPDGRQLCPDGLSVAPGTRCFRDAYTGSVDARWRSNDGDYAVAGQAIVTATRGGPDRLLPDGTVLRSGDLGPAGSLYVAKEGGKSFVADATYTVHGKKALYDDMGFLERANQHQLEANLEHRTLDPWGPTLETHSRLEYVERDNLGGLNLARYLQLNTQWKLDNFWTVFVEGHHRMKHFDDREVGDGTALERAGLWGFEVSGNTDPRAPVSLTLFTQTQFLTNGYRFAGDATLTVRPLTQLDVDLIPEVLFTEGEPRYVAPTGTPGRNLFGRLLAKSVSGTMRATYTFLPNLSLQAYAQLFLASRHYSEFSEASGTEVRLADLTRVPVAPAENPDTRDAALNLNVVLRWEYLLGSTLYVVYTRAQAPRVVLGSGELGDLSFRGLSRAPAADVFLVKASYWWGG